MVTFAFTDMNEHAIIAATAALINLITFSAFGIDKWKAKHDRWRIPESTLLLLAFFGGSAGAFAGMKVFRHKTRHRKFTILVPLFLVLQIIAAICILGRSTGCLQM